MKINLKVCLISAVLFFLSVGRVYSDEIIIVPSGTNDDTELIQTALDALNAGDTLRLVGDFVHKKTIYLGSDFTWILDGTLTLAENSADNLDDYGLRYDGFDNSRRTAIASREGAKNIDFSGGIIYGNGDFNGRPTGLPRVRQVNMVFAENCYFHDFTVEDASDDCFTLGAASSNNLVERVIGRHAGGRVEKDGGNALTDVGSYNTWIDCIADQGGSDGWTPKCKYSTFIRCIASNNDGPGFGMYAREEGYTNNRDVGARIIGNKFIDCVAYGTNGDGFSFNISSNCPGGIIRDNFVQAVCYDNQGSGVMFRNKDDAYQGIIENNEVNIVCFGNKGLTKSGNNNSWAGGLGIENDSDHIIENVFGSVVGYDNGVDINLKGGINCDIKVYHPASENNPVVNEGDGSNKIEINDFSCNDNFVEWCRQAYCESITLTPPSDPSNLEAVTISFNRIHLFWKDNSDDETGFKIERRTDGAYTEIAAVGSGVTFFEDTGISPDITYAYRIRAFNNAGYSGYSNEVSISTDSIAVNSYVEIIFDDFEDNSYGNWNDGGDDCKVNPSEYAHQGLYSVNLESNTATSLVTTRDLALSYYDYVIVEFWYKAVSMETGEDFWLQISTDGGNSFTTVNAWTAGEDFENDQFYSDAVTISGYTFTDQTRIRFRIDAGDDDDDIYLDEIRVSAGSGDITSIDGTKSFNPDGFVLRQNYPNPFNPTTTIEYSIPVYSKQYAVSSRKKTDERIQISDKRNEYPASSSVDQSFNQPIAKSNGELVLVQVKVFDILGREVATLVDKEQQPGIYKIHFDGSGLTSGTYILQMYTGEYKGSLKMMLVK